jgi:hypothetical protein
MTIRNLVQITFKYQTVLKIKNKPHPNPSPKEKELEEQSELVRKKQSQFLHQIADSH